MRRCAASHRSPNDSSRPSTWCRIACRWIRGCTGIICLWAGTLPSRSLTIGWRFAATDNFLPVSPSRGYQDRISPSSGILSSLGRSTERGQWRSWGRGTNRVIDMCRDRGVASPELGEREGFLVVPFRANIACAAPPAEPVTSEVAAQVAAQVTAQIANILRAAKTPKSREELQAAADITHREHFRKAYLLPAQRAGFIEYTVPDKPNSRPQRYRTTARGQKALETKGG